MLAQELARLWHQLDITVQEGLDQLASLWLTEIKISNQPDSYRHPTPRDNIQRLLDAAHIRLPAKITSIPSRVSTKTKLTDRRK
jgi:hypothetical protein